MIWNSTLIPSSSKSQNRRNWKLKTFSYPRSNRENLNASSLSQEMGVSDIGSIKICLILWSSIFILSRFVKRPWRGKIWRSDLKFWRWRRQKMLNKSKKMLKPIKRKLVVILKKRRNRPQLQDWKNNSPRSFGNTKCWKWGRCLLIQTKLSFTMIWTCSSPWKTNGIPMTLSSRKRHRILLRSLKVAAMITWMLMKIRRRNNWTAVSKCYSLGNLKLTEYPSKSLARIANCFEHMAEWKTTKAKMNSKMHLWLIRMLFWE